MGYSGSACQENSLCRLYRSIIIPFHHEEKVEHMSSQRRAEERQSRKERIAQAALKVFAERGIEASKMEEIAAEAGFGRASLYYYFPSREDIFQYIFELGWTRLWEGIEDEVNAEGTARTKFMGTLKRISQIAQSDRSLYNFLFAGPKTLLTVPTSKQSWKPHQERLYTVLRGLLEDGIAAGEFPSMPAGVLMRAIGGLFHGLMFLGDAKREVNESDVEELVKRILDNPAAGGPAGHPPHA